MEIVYFVVKSIILGIVEGVTEFLPVSSTGHILLVGNFIGFNGVSLKYVEMYTYVIQLGAILAVVVLYWERILRTFKNFSPRKAGYEKSGFKFWFMIFIACIPGGIFTILLSSMAEKYLFSPVPIAIALFLGGVLMIYAENKHRDNNVNVSANEINISPRQALKIGLFQCLSIIPGMSRSASTIIGGWMSGLSTVVATEFSFFLAVPVMIGMSFMKILEIGGFLGLLSLTPQEIISLAVGFFVSFIVALSVVSKFIKYLKKKPMRVFAIYRMIFAVIIILATAEGFFPAS